MFKKVNVNSLETPCRNAKKGSSYLLICMFCLLPADDFHVAYTDTEATWVCWILW